jgi:hypothetical protein
MRKLHRSKPRGARLLNLLAAGAGHAALALRRRGRHHGTGRSRMSRLVHRA